MSVFYHTYSVDLRKPLTAKQTQALLLTQDEMSDRIIVEVYDGGAAYNLTGSGTATIVRGDGQTVDATPTISGNTMTLDLPAEAYNVVGVIMITMRETVTETVNNTSVTRINALLNLTATVRKSTTESHIDPGSETTIRFTDLIQTLDGYEQILSDVGAATTAANNAASAATTAIAGAVRHDTAQTLGDTAKAQARSNISAVTASVSGTTLVIS